MRGHGGDGGGVGELGGLLEALRPRLRRMIALRLHPRVRARVDASDVLQDTFMEAARRYDAYADSPTVPFYFWVRRIASDRLFELHRHHLGAKKRDARREAHARPEVSTDSLSKLLLDPGPTASEVCRRNEDAQLLQAALESMDANEREALTLRHFEEATNAQVARVLGVSEATASRYYMRALGQVRVFLEQHGRRADPRTR